MIYKDKTLTVLSEKEKSGICSLWNNEYPLCIRQKDVVQFENYLGSLGNPLHTLFMDKDENILGWFCVFRREDKYWFALILDSKLHGKGIGRSILLDAKSNYSQLFGWAVLTEGLEKQDGSIYRPSIGFYKRLGLTIYSDEVFETELMSTVKIGWE